MHKKSRPHFGNGRTRVILWLLFHKNILLEQVTYVECRKLFLRSSINLYSFQVILNITVRKKTYSRIPFYIGMPMSTLDMSCPSGDDIPIEERPPG